MTVEILDGGAERFITAGGVSVTRQRHPAEYGRAIETYINGLDSRRGAVFSSNYEYPGRYTRWDTAIIDPPLVISAKGRAMRLEALNERGRVQAIKIWKSAKESGDTFDTYARAFYEGFGRDRHHVLNMLDLLFSTAAADGGLHPREEELLLRAAGIFQIGRLQYERVKSRFYHSRMGGGGNNSGASQRWSPLDPHYAILGAEPTESLDSIKKKYRALAMQWHPDTMAAKGVSNEAMRHAKEKFQQINEAYERITESRKVG